MATGYQDAAVRAPVGVTVDASARVRVGTEQPGYADAGARVVLTTAGTAASVDGGGRIVVMPNVPSITLTMPNGPSAAPSYTRQP